MKGPFSDLDKAQLEALDISLEQAYSQLERLFSKPAAVQLAAAATVGKGILPKSLLEQAQRSVIPQGSRAPTVVKFVPASGAATRMFKHLLAGDPKHPLWRPFFEGWNKFAFLDSIAPPSEETEITSLIQARGWAKMPKGLIPFHAYEAQARNPFQEHVLESRAYLSAFGASKIHFTVAPDFLEDIALSVEQVSEKHGLQGLETSYSFQNRSTDTLALSDSGDVVRTNEGTLFLRPGGHGALLSNLDAIAADYILLRNIDNIAKENHWAVQHKYQKGLLHLGMAMKSTIDSVLRALFGGETPEESDIRALEAWSILDREDHSDLAAKLDRPMRLVAMVPNVGEPGGGPFWTRESGLQVVETAEMDLSSQDQAEMVKGATHFNPVNMLCAKARFDGTSYALSEYVDDSRYFVSTKSMNGSEIKVLEHPGLWNGSMGEWTTVFVEMPIETFNPVKTVNDLLRPAHQS